MYRKFIECIENFVLIKRSLTKLYEVERKIIE